VGDNQPYAGNLIEDTMYKHGLKNKIIHTLIETRNDLLLKPRDISSVANILYKAITSSKKRIKEYL
jgi:predicted N-formylglutamate amidohydrolase